MCAGRSKTKCFSDARSWSFACCPKRSERKSVFLLTVCQRRFTFQCTLPLSSATTKRWSKPAKTCACFSLTWCTPKSAYAASKCSWTKRTPETHFVHVHTARATPNSSMRTTRTRGCNTWRTCTRRGLPYTLSPKRWGWISLLSTCCTWRPCLASNNLQKTPWPSRSSKSTRW